jgi:hypothetical protein
LLERITLTVNSPYTYDIIDLVSNPDARLI